MKTERGLTSRIHDSHPFTKPTDMQLRGMKMEPAEGIFPAEGREGHPTRVGGGI